MHTASGTQLLRDIFHQATRPQGVKLIKQTLAEFTSRAGGIVLPDARVAKEFDRDRVRNVVWKITRELFFVERNAILPEDTPVVFRFLTTDDAAPPWLQLIDTFPSRGRYTGVFDYKYTQVREVGDSHWWALLFWDKLISVVVFHDPE